MASLPYSRMQILDWIESGVITAGEGVQLLQKFAGYDQADAGEEPEPAASSQTAFDAAAATATGDPDLAETSTTSEEDPAGAPSGQVFVEGFRRWPRWWFVPFGLTVGVTLAAAVLMALAYRTLGIGFWFFCSGLLLVAGLTLGLLVWQARKAPWLHLRVEQKAAEWPRFINLGFPLPLRTAAWFVHLFKPWLPESQKGSLEEMLLALGRTITSGNPFHLEYEGRPGGERVELFIG